MKLSFTTLGCPDWDMDTIISRAVEYGFDAVNFRGYLGVMNIYELPEFSTQAGETATRFADANLSVSCFSSSARIFSTGSERESYLEEIKRYAELCEIFGTSYIRVFGGDIGETRRADAIEIAAECFRQMADIAAVHHITLVLETHDAWLHAEHIRAVLERVDSESVGVLWDIHHPYRMVGEDPATTWQVLGKWIQYTHWKDSNPKDTGHQLCLIGEGDIPLKQIYDLLIQNGYTGYFTLEWEKKWHPEIEEPEIAFPRYVEYMKGLSE